MLYQKQFAPFALIALAGGLLAALLLVLATGPVQAQETAADSSGYEWVVEAQSGDFAAISMVEPNLGWAMTSSRPKLFYRYDGQKWQQTTIEIAGAFTPTGTVNDFVMTGPDSGWAVGVSPDRHESYYDSYYYGRVWHLADGLWTREPITPAARLDTIKRAGSNSGYAYGDRVLYYYAGDAWSLLQAYVEDNFFYRLTAADGLADGSRFWFANQPTPGYDFLASQLIDSQAGTQPFTLANSLTDLDILSAEHGWAVGVNGYILRFDGTTWETVVAPTEAGDSLTQVQVADVDDVFILGYSAGNQDFVLHYDAGTWTRTLSPIVGQFSDLELLSTDDGWIVTQNGGVLHWDGSGWRDRSATVTPPPAGPQIGELRMFSTTFGVAAAGNAILTYTGEGWQPAPLGDRHVTVNAVEVLSPTFAVAVGSVINEQRLGEESYAGWQFDGADWIGQWQSYPACGADSVQDVSLLDLEFGWMTGFKDCNDGYGDLMQFVSGNFSWSGDTFPQGQWPRRLTAISNTDGWMTYYDVVAGRDAVKRYDGMIWSDYELIVGPCQMLHGFVYHSASDVWAVATYQPDCGTATPAARASVILHFDGVGWTSQPAPGGALLRGIDVLAGGEMWVVGEEGAIYRYDGVAWSKQSSPVMLDLLGIDMLDSTHGRIWGERGTILNLEEKAGNNLYLPAIVRD